MSKQETEELQHQLQNGCTPGQMGIPLSHIDPKTEVYHQLLEHTEPLHTVLQYYQAYWAIDLLISNLPLPKKGVTFNLKQFRELWEHANPKARDTLAFM